MSGSGNASPQVRVNNGINMNNIRGNQQQQSLYSMGSSSNYGYSRLQQQGHYQPLPIRQPHEANNSVYSAPPPPLPYRPPPPNPYNLPYNNVNNNLRPSPTNMRLSPSPPSITGSTPPPHGGTHGGTPPCMATYARVSNLKKVINNGGMGHNNGGIVQQNQQITSQSQGNGNAHQGNATTVRNVRFADEQNGSANGLMNSSSTTSSTSSSATSSGGSGSSGPSSIESVQRNSNNSGLYDKTLVVIEKSNKELEKNLTLASEVNVSSLQQQQPQQQQPQTPSKQPPLLIRPRLVDTIHNNKNSLATEIIYEVEPGSSQETSIIIGSPSSHQPQHRQPLPQQQQQQSQSQNGPNFLQKQPLNGSSSTSELRTDVLLRSASQAQLNQLKNQDMEGNSSVAPSYPSLSDLSIADLSSFKSLTAQKLMAGLSFNSIDTLLEVNAAAEARSKLNESTETVDFGII